jgi:hypothetical protein
VERGLAVDEDRGRRGRSMRSISLRTISTATWPR